MIRATKQFEDDFDGDEPLQQEPKPGKFLTIGEDENKSRFEIHVKGMFADPQMISFEIANIIRAAAKYETCIVYINTNGGRVDTLIELMNALKHFKILITVGTGAVQSSGFMLWSIGHLRVVQPYTMFMAHRESYHMSGKTDQHLEMSMFTARNLGKFAEDVFADILTPQELDRMKTTELYFTAEDLVERGVAISWDQFCDGESLADTITAATILNIGGVNYIRNEDGHLDAVNIEVVSEEPKSLIEIVYKD